jgi:hypothetical protein
MARFGAGLRENIEKEINTHYHRRGLNSNVAVFSPPPLPPGSIRAHPFILSTWLFRHAKQRTACNSC